MAVNWPWAALYASGHKELRKGGDTIPCTFSRGVAVALLYTSSVFPDVPCLLGIKYVPNSPGRWESISLFLYLLHPIREQSGSVISKSSPQDSSVLTGKSEGKELLQGVDKKEFGKVSITACTSEEQENEYVVGTTMYSLTCPCKFCFQQKYQLKFYPKFMRYLRRVWH